VSSNKRGSAFQFDVGILAAEVVAGREFALEPEVPGTVCVLQVGREPRLHQALEAMRLSRSENAAARKRHRTFRNGMKKWRLVSRRIQLSMYQRKH